MRPADLGYTMPAEWAPHAGCWMAWPTRLGLWGEHLEGARDDYARVAQAIAEFEPVTMIADPAQAAGAAKRCGPSVKIVSMPIDDSWLRDSAHGVGEDTGVFDTLRRAYPDREVVPVALKDLFRGGGGIHCITQQEPIGEL